MSIIKNIGQNFIKNLLSLSQIIVTTSNNYHIITYLNNRKLFMTTTTANYSTARNYSTRQQQQHKENYYDILGLNKNCSQNDIRQAYLNLCKKFHPDKSSNGDNTALFQKINEAYDCLSKVDKRNQYDLSINNGGHDFNDNPFIKTRTAATKGYYYQSPLMNNNYHYQHNEHFNYNNYYQKMRYEFMHQQQHRQGFTKIQREMFGSKFTAIMFLTLIITMILQSINILLNFELNEMNMKKRYDIITELYNKSGSIFCGRNVIITIRKL